MFDDDLWKSYVYWTTFSNVKGNQLDPNQILGH